MTKGLTVSNGHIIAPNGTVWRGYGVGVYGETDVGFAADASVTGGGAALAQQMRAELPGLNLVRIASYSLSDPPSAYASFVNDMTSAGVEVVFEDHNTSVTVLTGSALTAESNWYASLARYYIDNPLVMFQTMNEPGSNDYLQMQATYNAIRGAGSNALIAIEAGHGAGGDPTTLAPTIADAQAVFSQMHNIVWDMHAYADPAEAGYSLAQTESWWDGYVNGMKAVSSADGVIPMMSLEGGNSEDGTNISANAGNMINVAFTDPNMNGFAAWNWNQNNQSSTSDNLTNPGGTTLNSYGQEVAGYIAAGQGPQNPNPPPNPANVVTGSGSDTLLLSISEHAYANGDGTSDANGDAAFTVSVDGKQLAGTFYATASHSSGASQAFTFMGNWAPGTHIVTVAFTNDAYGGTASTDRNLYVNDVTYDGTDTKQNAAISSTGSQSFSVTDSTALPPPLAGAGQDLLLLEVSEDYYQGNAQFTVAVDGKQLGGTFTATTLHSSGGYQSFAFAGDFGTGSHTVTVNFLNDAYGGSANTDRNLYVNDIIYNGTDTHQGKELNTIGPRNFSVTGGTTQSVSETSDHGSLQKTLAQTGTYAVGSDSFVLSSGNAVAVTLGTGVSNISFIGASAVTLTGGSGQVTVTADMGANKFVAGTGSLDVSGGAGKDAYVFHATSGVLTVEDFSLAKNDTLTIDKSLQGSLHQASDGIGGTLLTFGTAERDVDLRGVASISSSNIIWA